MAHVHLLDSTEPAGALDDSKRVKRSDTRSQFIINNIINREVLKPSFINKIFETI